jgi:hypothetical protein
MQISLAVDWPIKQHVPYLAFRWLIFLWQRPELDQFIITTRQERLDLSAQSTSHSASSRTANRVVDTY